MNNDLQKGGEGFRRREFLKTGLYAGLGIAFVKETSAASEGIVSDGQIPSQKFGKTPYRLPILAFGGSAMVERWSAAYGPTLSFGKRVAMVQHAYEKGVRYFDSSRNYSESEPIIGEALKGIRSQVFLASKVGVRGDDKGFIKPDEVRASLERSLKELGTDYLDCVQIHGPLFEYLGYDSAMATYEELDKLKSEKLFHYIGLTSHTAFETMYRLIDTKLFDQALIAYGYFPKGMDTILSHSNLQWRERCLSRAHELGMGVLAMKTLGSFVFGARASNLAPQFDSKRLDHLRQAALRWVLKDDRVTLLLVGTCKPRDIDQNVATLNTSRTFQPADQSVLAEFTSLAFRSEGIKSMKVT